MPKEKESSGEFLSRMAQLYKGVLRTDKKVLFCIVCNSKLTANKIFGIKQHFESAKHKASAERQNNNSVQTLMADHANSGNINTFNMDLCKMLISANIPINKVSHPAVIEFLDKHTKSKTPSQSSLRNKYVPILYDRCIEKLRQKAKNKYIWISIDETTDVEQRLIANAIFGVLDDSAEEKDKSYLLNIQEVETANASSMAAFLNDSLQILWPERMEYEKLLLVVTDSAAYMLAAMSSLKVLYPKMLHVTCFAHGLHRLAEFIRFQFSNVNKLISSTKAIYSKAPSRRHEFKRLLPHVKLPPQPCTTRWGTWLSAAEYYCDFFEEVRSVIDELSNEESEAIIQAKAAFAYHGIVGDLAYIKNNFSCIGKNIKKLETKGLPLNESLNIIEKILLHLHKLDQNQFKEKFSNILKRNGGFKSIMNLSNILYQNGDITDDYVKKLSPREISCFKYAPTTSTDVERSFSSYVTLLTDNRRSFTVENI